MNIESQNVSPMPALDRAVPLPSRPDEEATPVAAASTQLVAQMVKANAASTNATKQRISIAEKALGVGKALIIERDSVRQSYIYKTVDRATGEVTRVWPIEEVASALASLHDRDAQAVMSGMMINATA